tara:strand:- start:8469 stop:8984 length:516 start_codon:yes stop_codon:yes gene_type:complete
MCVTAMIMLAATGAVVQAKAADSAAKAQANAARYQADVATNNAQIARDQAQFEADGHDRDVRRMLASNRAGVSASGITSSGSALDVQMDSVEQAEMDKLAIMYGGDMQAGNFEAEAMAQKQAAKDARTAGKYAVGTSLLSGATKIAGGIAATPHGDAGYFTSAGRARIAKP